MELQGCHNDAINIMNFLQSKLFFDRVHANSDQAHV